MSGWREHEGMAVGLPTENIDTDQLIPARFMSTPRSEGYGDFLLHDVRGGDPDFPLNHHPTTTVLVTRRNFGSGSSREAAVYALVDYGIRAVIAPSFGDIFAGNAVNNGLLAAALPEEDVADILGSSGISIRISAALCRGNTPRFNHRRYPLPLPRNHGGSCAGTGFGNGNNAG